jgi:hypothetical protein
MNPSARSAWVVAAALLSGACSGLPSDEEPSVPMSPPFESPAGGESSVPARRPSHDGATSLEAVLPEWEPASPVRVLLQDGRTIFTAFACRPSDASEVGGEDRRAESGDDEQTTESEQEEGGFATFKVFGINYVPDDGSLHCATLATRIRVLEWRSVGDCEVSGVFASIGGGVETWRMFWTPTKRQCLAILSAADVEWDFEGDVLRLAPEDLESLQEYLGKLARRSEGR